MKVRNREFKESYREISPGLLGLVGMGVSLIVLEQIKRYLKRNPNVDAGFISRKFRIGKDKAKNILIFLKA